MSGWVGGGSASFQSKIDRFEMDTDNNHCRCSDHSSHSLVQEREKELFLKDLDSYNTYHTSESDKKQVQILIHD